MPRTTEALIRMLTSGDAKERRKAAARLGKRRDAQALEMLIAGLADEKWQVRRSAARALSRFTDQRAIDALSRSLSDRSKGVCRQCIRSLGKIAAPSTVGALMPGLAHSYYGIREETQEALAVIGRPAVPHLCMALGRSEEHVREGATQTLVSLFLKQSGDTLTTILEHPDVAPQARWAALATLCGVGGGWFRRPAFSNIWDYCEAQAASHPSEAARTGAHSVLEYMTLVRPGIRSTAGDGAMLMRAAADSGRPDEVSSLLQASGSYPLDAAESNSRRPFASALPALSALYRRVRIFLSRLSIDI